MAGGRGVRRQVPVEGEEVRATAAAEAPVASGLYRWSPAPGSPRRDELRLDVDGWHPQRLASGLVRGSAASSLHWIAELVKRGPDTWRGPIWYRDGQAALLRHTRVSITVRRHADAAQQTAVVRFSGGGTPLERVYSYTSRFFHPVSFELDVVEGSRSITSFDTGSHPNRPATLPVETLTIQNVFRRAGFDVSTSRGSGRVPLRMAGRDALWTDREMHDAMQSYWSKFDDRAQWAMWTLFASLHKPDPGDAPEDLGGIMFDDIGPNHRQGTSVFVDSFIAEPPPGDPEPDAWVRRMTFWCACHEMGHAFNLAHSWDKAESGDWISLEAEPEARSFMNYPYNVAGEEPAFFSDFAYRFSDAELAFMRHAPGRFVQMGNAEWFDHHAFERAAAADQPALVLEVRANRERPIFEFMEPVTLELKLTNVSRQPVLVDRRALEPSHGLTVILARDARTARQFRPYARYCFAEDREVLAPGASKYASLYVSSGATGWALAEPGGYTAQVALRRGEEDIVSRPLRLRVAPPGGHDEELLAQDFFADDVGRIVAFDGSRFLSAGNDVLREVAARLPARRVALHAALALGECLTRADKELVADAKEPMGMRFREAPADPKTARALLGRALEANAPTMAESLGHIDFQWYVDRFTDWLEQQGDPAAGRAAQDKLLATLSARVVRGRKVLDSVLARIQARRDALPPPPKRRGPGARKHRR